MFRAKTLCFIATLMLFIGCATVEKHHHLLSAADLPENSVANERYSQQTIAIRQIRLPDYLNEYNLMYQSKDQEVIIDKNQLWAQDLSDNIKRVIQQNISKQLPNASVYSYPLSANLRPERIIDVQIIEMIANKEHQTLEILANWQVVKPNERNPISHTFRQDYFLKDDSITTIVMTYQQALADLSVMIIPTI